MSSTLSPPPAPSADTLASPLIDGLAPGNWANLIWFPANALHLGVIYLTVFVVAWEWLSYVPSEIRTWYNLFFKERTVSRAFLPWAILWLRYMSLGFLVLLILFQLAGLWVAPQCHAIYVLFIISTIVTSFSTAAVLGWRALTIARTAWSPAKVSFLRVIVCGLCIAQLAVNIGGWVGTTGLAGTQAVYGFCQASADLSYGDDGGQGSYVRSGSRPLYGAFAANMVYDLVVTCVASLSLHKLNRASVVARNTRGAGLVDLLLNNSIRYFCIIFGFNIFGLVLFDRTGDASPLEFVSAVGVCIAVRVLVSEQDLVRGNREADEAGYPAVIRRRCGACGANADQELRIGGMTDIERVPVLPHGRSRDRPWPIWRRSQEEQSRRPSAGINHWVADTHTTSAVHPDTAGIPPADATEWMEKTSSAAADNPAVEGTVPALPRGAPADKDSSESGNHDDDHDTTSQDGDGDDSHSHSQCHPRDRIAQRDAQDTTGHTRRGVVGSRGVGDAQDTKQA